MEQVQIYDAVTNIVNRENQQIQSGMSTFKLPQNKSGKISVKFSPSFTKVPMFTHSINVVSGNPLDVFSSLANLNESGCDVHVCNADLMNECSLQLFWHAE